MARAGWSGVFPYLPTPVDGEGRFSRDTLTAITRSCLAAGVDGLTPLGSSGQIALLDAATRRRVIEAVVAAAAGRVPVVAGVCGFGTGELVAQARVAEECGADGILLVLMGYDPLRDDEIVRAVDVVARAVHTPLVLYNNPPLTHVDLTPAVIAAAARQSGIRYVKDASGAITRIPRIRALTDGAVHVFAATAVSPSAAMLLGAVGWMSGPAAVFPAAAVRIRDAVRAGDWADATATERALGPALDVFRRLGPARAVSALFAAVGTTVGAPMPPLSPPRAADVDEAAAAARSVHAWMERPSGRTAT